MEKKNWKGKEKGKEQKEKSIDGLFIILLIYPRSCFFNQRFSFFFLYKRFSFNSTGKATSSNHSVPNGPNLGKSEFEKTWDWVQKMISISTKKNKKYFVWFSFGTYSLNNLQINVLCPLFQSMNNIYHDFATIVFKI